MNIYIYIYIERERERDRQTDRQRKRDRERERERGHFISRMDYMKVYVCYLSFNKKDNQENVHGFIDYHSIVFTKI